MFSTEQAPWTLRRLLPLTALATAAAVTAHQVLRLAGQDLEVVVRGEARPVPVGAVIVATAIGGLAASLLARLAAHSPRPRAVFIGAVIAGLALAAVPPAQTAVTTASAVWLLVLHLLVAAVLVPFTAWALPLADGERQVAPGTATAAAGR